MEMELTLVDQVRRLVAQNDDATRSLPPQCYTDPRFFELEVDKVFALEWLCIGRAADIPEPGDYLTLDTAHARVMAVRQKNGAISVMSRVCRHRGALLGADEGGNARVFVCPYHNWTYELDGKLRAAPAMAANTAFDQGSCALPVFKTEIWEGFIFFSTDPAATPLAPRLGTLAPRIEPYRLAELRTAFVISDMWHTNWKVAFENGTETYHHMGVHRETLQPAFPTMGTRCEPGDSAYNLHVVPARAGFSFDPEDAGSDAGGSHDSPVSPRLSELLIVGIYPGLALVFSGTTVTWFTFTPIDVTRTALRVGSLVPAKYFQRPDYLQTLARDREFLERVLAEDKESCAAVQHGLGARDAVAGALSSLELTVAQFGRYLARCLSR